MTDLSYDKLITFMTYTKKDESIKPIFVTRVNSSFILAAYQGSFSEFDILIKYRQFFNGNWSRIRTPRHIHWTVDVLIKMHSEKEKTIEFLEFLLEMWSSTTGIKSKQEQENALNIEKLIEECSVAFEKYNQLSKKGEYSIKFLILLAKLLMIQEKTNLETAYMFKELIEDLKDGSDIFRIVGRATHR